MAIRKTPGPVMKALTASLKNAQLQPEDGAAIALAKRYAKLIDEWEGDVGEEEQVEKLGPKFLAVLESLAMTPKGRGIKPKGGVENGTGSSKLDELRARRARKNGATSVDAAAAQADA